MNKTIRITLGILSGILCIGIIATIPVHCMYGNYGTIASTLAFTMVFGHTARRLLLNKIDTITPIGFKMKVYLVELVLFLAITVIIALLFITYNSFLQIPYLESSALLFATIIGYFAFPSPKQEWKNRNNRRKNNNV